ncbi:NTP transferase domain-containing protein [Arthrobacter sp.]|uniref:NTP transferase domain-containing protein n=1 Tax=Arthrobacter sp. TaxID=1667 RepID=UPI0026E058AA|nr:NTP transferase domain-containing protein [Arthrobacter sp.]MDO5752757.1 NTP transferase domain-containing protein [Arthrobacter sp.]
MAVILAGGMSRRLGGVPKAGLLLEGQTLLARTVDGAMAAIGQGFTQPTTAGGGVRAGARIAVVGPVDKTRDWIRGARSHGQVMFVQEDPPYSGPAAGIAAGLAALAAQALPALDADTDAGPVLVLACDMPRASEIAALLVDALADCEVGSGIMAVDNGRKQPLAGIYPLAALNAAVDAARQAGKLQDASVFSLLASVFIKECVVPVGLSTDIDTWQDARAQGIDAWPAEAEGQ